MTKEILKDEILKDEQLEQVAGGVGGAFIRFPHFRPRKRIDDNE